MPQRRERSMSTLSFHGGAHPGPAVRTMPEITV